MKHRAACIVLILCLVCALLPASAGAADVVASGACGPNAAWVITDDGIMTITGTGTVTSLMADEAAHAKPENVHTLIVCEGITRIAAETFSNRSGAQYLFQTVVLPDSLRAIGDEAFMNQVQLTEIRFGAGLESIGKCAFYGCEGLSALELPDRLKRVDSSAFWGCTALREMVVPGSVKTLGDSVFAHCTGLERVILLDGVQEIGDYLFGGCSALEQVYLPDTIRFRFLGTFSGCEALREIRLPAQTTTLRFDTFFNCKALERVIMPGTIDMIEYNAFSNTPSLKEIYYAGSEEQLNQILIQPDGNQQLKSVVFHQIPAMPDPVFYLYDMPKMDNWAYPGVAFCLNTGLMNGVGNGYFQPNGTTTRAQLVTILWRLMGEPEAARPAPFTDLKQDWYREAVAWAAENNITNGTSAATFSPDMPVTREQMVTIFYRMCRDYLKMDVSPAASLAGFPDSASVSAWAQDAVQWAVAVKLISGVGDGRGNSYLQPQGSATRAQIATVMLNFVNAFGSEAEVEAFRFNA